jgi:hypothetical protein
MSDDNTQLELEFHWLARPRRDSITRVDLLEQPLSSLNRTESTGEATFCIIDNSTKKPILLYSGYRFTMRTDDPENLPLPDPGLLEMQWHLQRILAMSGAAGWKEEDFDHDLDAAVDAIPSVEQWPDDQLATSDHSRSSSPESVEIVDGESD